MNNIASLVFFFIAILTLVISLIFFNIFSFFPHTSLLVVFLPFSLACLSFGYIARFIHQNFKAKIKESKAYYTAYWGMFFLSLFSLVLSLSLSHLYSLRNQNNFEAENTQESKSKEFQLIQKLGYENNVFIKLGDKANSWALTRLLVPNASGASIFVGNGYCQLNYSDSSIQDMKKSMLKNVSTAAPYEPSLDVAKLTIMVHELAHCIDMKRDFLTFNLEQSSSHKSIILSTYAIAPKYRKNVHNIESYLTEASKKESTLWKEVFADLYAVGYTKVHYPAIAQTIALNLREYRSKAASEDPEHMTACWLDQAMNDAAPKNDREITKWADAIRNNQSCKNNFY